MWVPRFIDVYDDGGFGLDDLKFWRDINVPLLESGGRSWAVSLEDVWVQLKDLFTQQPLPGVHPPSFAQQVQPYTLASASCWDGNQML